MKNKHDIITKTYSVGFTYMHTVQYLTTTYGTLEHKQQALVKYHMVIYTVEFVHNTDEPGDYLRKLKYIKFCCDQLNCIPITYSAANFVIWIQPYSSRLMVIGRPLLPLLTVPIYKLRPILVTITRHISSNYGLPHHTCNQHYPLTPGPSCRPGFNGCSQYQYCCNPGMGQC